MTWTGARRHAGTPAAALLLVAALAGCGTEAGADPDAGSPITDPGDDPSRLEVRTSTDTLDFVPAELTVASGQVFSVRFANASTTPHSWSLVQAGDEQAARAGQLPGPDKKVEPTPPGAPVTAAPTPGRVIADTSGTVAPDQARVVQVQGLPVGSYTYLCTLDDHAEQGMTGTLTVEPAPAPRPAPS